MMSKYQAAVFDMDGLLIDSERIAQQCFINACECYGVPFNPSVYLQVIGTNATTGRQILIDGFGPEFPYDDVSNHWFENYKMLAFQQPVPLKKGAESLLKHFKRNDVPMAVATSTAYDKAIVKLKNSGLIDYFDFVIGGDMVEESKPHPMIYLTAAQQLQVEAENCLAFEDSNNGVKAAYAAGMFVFQVPDIVEPTDEIKRLGHPIFHSLYDVKDYLGL